LILVSESLWGVHKPPFPVKVVSTKGSSIVQYNLKRNDYEVSSGFDSIAQKGEVVLLGTDLDHTGTKVATVLAQRLREKGAVPIRFALTSKGYGFLGRFYNSREMEAFKSYDRLTRRISSFFREKYPNAPPTGLTTAVSVSKVYKGAKEGKRFKVPKGTNTASVITKALMRGKSVKGALRKLQNLYLSGEIEYPRVDNDLILDKPFEVYAHSPLTSLGYRDEEVSPFEEEEFPLTPYTVPVYLSLERSATPSVVGKETEKIYQVFDENLKVRNGFESYVRDCVAVAEELEEEHKRLLTVLSPRARKERIELERIRKEEELKRELLRRIELWKEEVETETEEDYGLELN